MGDGALTDRAKHTSSQQHTEVQHDTPQRGPTYHVGVGGTLEVVRGDAVDVAKVGAVANLSNPEQASHTHKQPVSAP